MAFIIKDRVKESTNSTGTGAITLGGAAATFDTFQSYMTNGDTTYYAIVHTASGTDEWEVGLGTWNTGNTLTRTTVLSGSNGTSAQTFSAGTKDVFMTYPAAHAALAEDDVTFDNITVTGTVDGRDVATDGTKLDTVEQNADVTDAVNVAAAGALMRSGGTMTGALILNADPSAALGAATKEYVDTIASAGIHYHSPVRAEHPSNLNATYNNGSSGVGATLTNAGTNAALVIDSVSMVLNDRVLVANQTTQTQNGVYTVTTVGDGSTAWVLTRSTDTDTAAPSDPDAFGKGDAFFIKEGATNAGHLDVLSTAGTIVFGTTNIVFSEVAETTVYSGGTGITLTGTTFAIGQDVATSASVTFNQVTADIIGNVTGNLTGDVTGNADTATTLETARNIQLSGDVTGSASFDGSANINITAAVQDDSHAHVISNVDGLQSALDAKVPTSRTITAGNGLTGGGNLTANRTISHADTSSQASVNGSGRTYIQDITLDTYGHVTGLATASETVTNTNQLTTFVVEDGDGTEVTISQGKEWKFVEGGAIDINWTDTSTGSDGDPFDLTISHVDTSSQASVNNSNGTVIQDVTLDTYGHVTGLGSANLDGRYVNVTGDTMTGNLTLDSGTSTTLSVKCDNSGAAIVRAGGDSQGTGVFEVTQDGGNHGGGISYNGDGSPAFASGETADHITFYRIAGGTRTEVFHYPYSSNTVNFNATPTAGGTSLAKTTDINNGTLTVQGTGALGGSGTFTANQSGNTTISISHDDTSSQASANNSGATVIQDVTLDGYGHVTGLGSHTLTLANLGYTGATNANNYSFPYTISQSAGNGTVVRRHDSGYIFANYFNTTPNDIATGSITKICAESGNDGYIRHASAAAVRSFIGFASEGSYIRSDADDNVSAHTEWQDNKNVRLGNGADFRMWFDGTNTYFRNYAHAGGNIYFQGEDTEGSNHALLYMHNDGSSPYLRLFQNGGERLRTLSGGVGVTGLTVGDVDANPHNANGLQVSMTNNEKIVLSGSADPYIRFQETTTDRAYIGWVSGQDALVFRNQQTDNFDFLPDASTGAVNLRLRGTDNDTWGSLYGTDNSNTNQIGLLDGDQNWAYRITNDTSHEWLINNVVEMSLSTSTLDMKGNVITEVEDIGLRDRIYHDGDTDTYIQFGTNTAAVVVGGHTEIFANTTGVRLGDTGNGYFQPVSGNYGSIQIDGGNHGGWEGYSIGGRVVLMHDNSSSTGIYNDVNNEWLFYGVHNSYTRMYHNGSSKVETSSSGVTVNGDLNSTSDIRYKKNIETIEGAVDKVTALRGVTFDWDNDAFSENETNKKPNFTERATGVIAQDVEKVLPEAVRQNPETGFKNVAYGNMVGLLIEAIKEQQTQIDGLKAEIQSMKS